MDTLTQSSPTAPSKAALWTGRVITALVGLFLLFDGVMKLVRPRSVVEATVKAGYAESVILPLGIVLTVSTILYLIPRTAVLGAILLTGYLGGAVDANVRGSQGPFFILLPAIFGVLVWLGLYLRDPRLRALTPIAANP
jgi:DoxX-like family